MRTGEAGGHVSIIKAANLAFRFLLELCALVALGSWGWHAGTGRAAKPVRVVLELAVFGAAAAGLTAAGRVHLAAALLLVYAVNRILMVAWGQ